MFSVAKSFHKQVGRPKRGSFYRRKKTNLQIFISSSSMRTFGHRLCHSLEEGCVRDVCGGESVEERVNESRHRVEKEKAMTGAFLGPLGPP